jgi:hypothetical protein
MFNDLPLQIIEYHVSRWLYLCINSFYSTYRQHSKSVNRIYIISVVQGQKKLISMFFLYFIKKQSPFILYEFAYWWCKGRYSSPPFFKTPPTKGHPSHQDRFHLNVIVKYYYIIPLKKGHFFLSEHFFIA